MFFAATGCQMGRFGPNCLYSCPENCKENQCDPKYGYCTKGCTVGNGPHCLRGKMQHIVNYTYIITIIYYILNMTESLNAVTYSRQTVDIGSMNNSI